MKYSELTTPSKLLDYISDNIATTGKVIPLENTELKCNSKTI